MVLYIFVTLHCSIRFVNPLICTIFIQNEPSFRIQIQPTSLDSTQICVFIIGCMVIMKGMSDLVSCIWAGRGLGQQYGTSRSLPVSIWTVAAVSHLNSCTQSASLPICSSLCSHHIF